MAKSVPGPIEKLFLSCLFLVAPVVDAITGYAVLTGRIAEGSTGSFSQGLRLVILMLALAVAAPPGRVACLLLTLWLMLLWMYYKKIFVKI